MTNMKHLITLLALITIYSCTQVPTAPTSYETPKEIIELVEKLTSRSK